MSALSFLFLIMPLTAVFTIHTVETALTFSTYITPVREKLIQLFPKSETLVESLSGAGKGATFTAAIESSAVFFAIWCAYLYDMPYSTEMFTAFITAYTIHYAIKITMAITIRKYTPGVVSATLFFPLTAYTAYSACRFSTLPEIVSYTAIGIAVWEANLFFSLWLGKKIRSKTSQTPDRKN